MRARCQSEHESIPIPTPIQTMIWLIGNYCMEATHDGTRLFGQSVAIAHSDPEVLSQRRWGAVTFSTWPQRWVGAKLQLQQSVLSQAFMAKKTRVSRTSIAVAARPTRVFALPLD